MRSGRSPVTTDACDDVGALPGRRERRIRPPVVQTVVHCDRGTPYTAWAFGQRLRAAGLLGSMGRVGSALNNAMT